MKSALRWLMSIREPDPEVIPESEPVRFCRDCKHRRDDEWMKTDREYDGCYSPQNLTRNLVSGDRKRKWRFCATLRNGSGGDVCGAPARWFQPIEEGVKE